MFELIAFSEIDKSTADAYCCLHNVNNSQNLGDIRNVSKDSINTDVDFLVGGTPCQDFSTAGIGKGCLYNCTNCNYSYNPLTISRRNRENCPRCGKRIVNKTRSSLLLEFLRIIKEIKPKVVVWENVKAVATHKRYRVTFDLFIQELQSYGYNVYTHFTNALNYGIPQNRERVFLVCIQNIFDTKNVTLTQTGYRTLSVDDIILPATAITDLWLSDKCDTDQAIIDSIKNNCTKNKVQDVYNKIGYIPTVFSLRNSHDLKYFPCITTGTNSASGDGTVIIKQHNRLRKIAPQECWRLMGFNDTDFINCSTFLSDRKLRICAGNSIVVDTLVTLFNDLYKSQPHLFSNNSHVLSLCSGIGAAERALTIFYNKHYKYTNASSPTNKYTIDNCLLQYNVILSIADICDILQIHRNTAYKLLSQIPHTKHGQQLFISKNDFIKYLNKKQYGVLT